VVRIRVTCDCQRVTPDTFEIGAGCTRPDCPTRGLDEAQRAAIAALPPAVHEAVTRAWCVNPRIVDGSLCAAAVAWYLANHAARGKTDSSQEERTRAPRGVPRTTRGSNKRSIT